MSTNNALGLDNMKQQSFYLRGEVVMFMYISDPISEGGQVSLYTTSGGGHLGSPGGGASPPHTLFFAQHTLSSVSNRRQCLLCNTANDVCCVTQQTMSAVSHSRQCLLCDTADMPPPACDTKPWFCVAGGRGTASPSCATKPRFCVAGGGGT